MRLSGYRCSLPGLAGFAGPHRTGLEPRKRIVAERVGFEPTLEFPLNTLSKRAPSATRSSLQGRPTLCAAAADAPSVARAGRDSCLSVEYRVGGEGGIRTHVAV